MKRQWCRTLIAWVAILSLWLLSFNPGMAMADEIGSAVIDSKRADRNDLANDLAAVAPVTIAKDEPKFLGVPLACYLSSAKAEANAQAQAFALIEVAQKYTKAGQKDKAAAVLDSSLNYLDGWDDTSANAFARVKLSTEYMDAGQPEQAATALEQSLPQIEAMTNVTDRALALTKVASQYVKLGTYEKANDLLDKALTVSNQVEDTYAKARVLLAIATAYNQAQNTDKSTTLLEQSLQLAQNLENPAAKARTFIEFAKTYAATEQPEKVEPALALAAEASEIAGAGLIGTSLSSFNSRALAYVANEYLTAGEYTAALDFAKRIGDPYERAIALAQIAAKYAASSQNPKAARALGQGLNAGMAVTDPLGKANSLAEVASVYTKLGKNRNAIKTLAQSLQAVDAAANNDDKVLLLLDITNQYVELGDRNTVNSLLTKIQNIMLDEKAQLSNKAGQLANVALIYSAMGQHDQALQIAKALDRQFGRTQLVNLLECASQQG